MQQPVLSSSCGEPDAGVGGWPRLARAGRAGWTVAAILVVETLVCGVAALPSVALWMRLATWTHDAPGLLMLLVALLAVPSYVLFALALMVCSALATRLTGARTVPDAALPIADMDWRLLRWVRYMSRLTWCGSLRASSFAVRHSGRRISV